MRVETKQSGASSKLGDGRSERASQAAQLIREALALLDVESESSLAFTSRRPPDRLLRLPEVERLTGLRRSAIYAQMERGTFPRSVKAGLRTATWSEAAIQFWIAERLGTQKQ
jgi:predicted DNA-binding transcriptional regulator AlpA